MQKQLGFDIVCFSGSSWNYIFDRTHHLMTKAALERKVIFVEPPVFGFQKDEAKVLENDCGMQVLTVCLEGDAVPAGAELDQRIASILEPAINGCTSTYVLWFSNLKALRWSNLLRPLATVYDCEAEPSAGVDEQLQDLEKDLLARADVLFTGGQALYESKFSAHQNVFPFPNRVSFSDFSQARENLPDPPEQAAIPHPRLGFVGKVDRRLNFDLISKIAADKPDWHFVFVGPLEVMDDDLPKGKNVHYLGNKDYHELPLFMSHWDVAIIPFAENEETRYLNPKKTAEYLASGVPVVSTAIPDVVRPFSLKGLLRIADNAEQFVESCQHCLDGGAPVDQEQIDSFLQQASWGDTWRKMDKILSRIIAAKIVALNGTLAHGANDKKQ